MRVLIAFDKFKDSMSAGMACAVAGEALRTACTSCQTENVPLTDGGDGFCEVLTGNARGEFHDLEVCGPLHRPVMARLGLVCRVPAAARERLSLPGASSLAVLEMAQATGLHQVPMAQRDAWHTTTRGTGEMLRYAVEQMRADAILLGVGGSATNDIGMGALQSLGLQCLDQNGAAVVDPIPANWARIAQLRTGQLLSLPPLRIACDVNNPLTGAQGASAVFGPQKGLRDVAQMDQAVESMAQLLLKACGQPEELILQPGTGAAGGIAFGLMAACSASLVPGWDLVSDWLGITASLERADIVITGEGRFDASSLRGKGPGSVLRAALEANKPVAVFAGSISEDARSFAAAHPCLSLHPVSPQTMPLSQALEQGQMLLQSAVTRWARQTFPDA